MSFRSGISIDCINDPLLIILISIVSAVNANIYGGEYTVEIKTQDNEHFKYCYTSLRKKGSHIFFKSTNIIREKVHDNWKFYLFA